MLFQDVRKRQTILLNSKMILVLLMFTPFLIRIVKGKGKASYSATIDCVFTWHQQNQVHMSVTAWSGSKDLIFLSAKRFSVYSSAKYNAFNFCYIFLYFGVTWESKTPLILEKTTTPEQSDCTRKCTTAKKKSHCSRPRDTLSACLACFFRTRL